VNTLNSKQKKILEDIFKEPVKSDVLWKDIEKVLAALGAEISEGNGSRIRIYLNGIRAVFHRPHPGKQTDKGALKSMRRFLIEVGVRNVKI
jgi:ABC-type phosphate transport system ATPase subunit